MPFIVQYLDVRVPPKFDEVGDAMSKADEHLTVRDEDEDKPSLRGKRVVLQSVPPHIRVSGRRRSNVVATR